MPLCLGGNVCAWRVTSRDTSADYSLLTQSIDFNTKHFLRGFLQSSTCQQNPIGSEWRFPREFRIHDSRHFELYVLRFLRKLVERISHIHRQSLILLSKREICNILIILFIQGNYSFIFVLFVLSFNIKLCTFRVLEAYVLCLDIHAL